MNFDELNNIDTSIIKNKQKNNIVNNKQEKKEEKKEYDLKVYSFTLYKDLVKELDEKLKEYNKNRINKLNRSKVINMLLNDYLDNVLKEL